MTNTIYMNKYNLQLINFKTFELTIQIFLSTLKDYVSYTFTNTPPPPLSNVQSGEVFF